MGKTQKLFTCSEMFPDFPHYKLGHRLKATSERKTLPNFLLLNAITYRSSGVLCIALRPRRNSRNKAPNLSWEEFCAVLNHNGVPDRDPTSLMRTLFVDLAASDIQDPVSFVCRIVRNVTITTTDWSGSTWI